MSSTIEFLVSFQTYKRKHTLEAGSKLKSLERELMNLFSNVLPDEAVSTDYVFQKFDPRFQEYVDMNQDDEIFNGDKLQVKSIFQSNPFIYPHKIVGDATYRIWSQVSRIGGSLMIRNNLKITCNGSVASDKTNLLNIKAKDVSKPSQMLFRLELADPNVATKSYFVTGKGEDKDVDVQLVDTSSTHTMDSESKFEPVYYYSFTRFRCSSVGPKKEIDLYLASDTNGRCTLVYGGLEPEYPDPTTLFICQKVLP